jgi:hypothetical protein
MIRIRYLAWLMSYAQPPARIWLAACLVPLMSACTLVREWTDPTTVSIRGVPPTLEQLNVSATIYAQNQLVYDLIVAAGFPPGMQFAARDDNWSLVAKAGIYEIGRQCDQYLDILFRFNREQRAGRQDLAAAAAATGAIMGLSGVSVKAIAITAAAFGLASSLFDASVNSVLFTIEPSALRNVALQGRKYYLEKLDINKVTTRPDMLIVLQGYLAQCSPAAIEANINNAAAGSLSVSLPNPIEAEKAATLAAPGATSLLQPKVGPPTDLRMSVQEVGPAPVTTQTETRPERAKQVVGRAVSPPPSVSQDQLAPNRLPDEGQLFKSEVRVVQAALGITPADGDPGTLDSPTRGAIKEFQKGMNLKDPRRWPKTEISGLLKVGTPTRRTLLDLSPIPTEFFSSPFERAFLGDSRGSPKTMLSKPSQGILDHVLQLLGVSATELPQGNSPNAIAAKIKLMHEKIGAFRQTKGIDPQKGPILDSALYDILSRQEGPIGPER